MTSMERHLTIKDSTTRRLQREMDRIKDQRYLLEKAEKKLRLSFIGEELHAAEVAYWIKVKDAEQVEHWVEKCQRSAEFVPQKLRMLFLGLGSRANPRALRLPATVIRSLRLPGSKQR